MTQDSKPLSFADWKSVTKPRAKGRVDILLYQIESKENLGLILRSAHAFAIDRILLLQPQCDIQHPKVKRIARHTNLLTHCELVPSWEKLKKDAYTEICALEYTSSSQSLYAYQASFPLLLVGGNEKRGLPQEIIADCTADLHIPIGGSQSSINLACACSIGMSWLYEYRTQRIK